MLTLLRVLPKAMMTRMAGPVMRSSLSRPFVPWFCRHYQINWREAAQAPESYRSIQEFFCRELKPGARPLDADPHGLVAPVDATVAQCGPIHNGVLLQAKGITYTVAELLADAEEARRYEGGWYLTLYLSPRDYHRIHAPADGMVRQSTYVPGSLWPVNREAVGHIRRLLARNERLITYLDAPSFGRLAVVKVGACMVGGIRVSYDPGLFATHQKGPVEYRSYPLPHALRKGQELGRFEFGSTVVLLAQPGPWTLMPNIAPDQTVRMGQRIALHAAGAGDCGAGKPPAAADGTEA